MSVPTFLDELLTSSTMNLRLAFARRITERAIPFGGPARQRARWNTKETPLSELAMFRMRTRLFSIARKSPQRRYCLCSIEAGLGKLAFDGTTGDS